MKDTDIKNVLITTPLVALDAITNATKDLRATSEYVAKIENQLKDMDKHIDTMFACLRDGEIQDKNVTKTLQTENEKYIIATDILSEIQTDHTRAMYITEILANKYFNNKPEERDNMLLFAYRYDEMCSLVDVIVEYNFKLQEQIKKLHGILEK